MAFIIFQLLDSNSYMLLGNLKIEKVLENAEKEEKMKGTE